MIAFMLQLALLLLVAYFAGAFAGCVVRRTFFPHTLRELKFAPSAAAIPVAPAPAMPKPTPAPVAAPAPAPAAAPESSGQTRFERALSGAGPGTAAAPATAPAPAPVPPTPAPAAPVTAKAATPVPATAPPAAPAPASTASSVAVAAAISAVAAAKAQQTAANLPAAMGTSGPASVTAPIAQAVSPAPAVRPTPVAPAPAPVPAPAPAAVASPAAAPPAPTAAPAQAQDLTRIRAIDDAMQQALADLGVRAFADIADWKPADVAHIAGALKIPGRIEQENWIEQAQILAKGGETYYSRRKLKGELPTARPTPDEGERITVRVPATMRPADAAAAAAPAAPPAAAAPAAPAAVDLKAAAAAAAAAVQAAQAAVKSAAPAAAVAVSAAPVVHAVSAAVEAAPRIVAVPAAQVQAPAPAPPAPAATPAPAVGMARDTLQRIAGINAEVERLLNVQGVTRYAQIAGWSASDVSRFDRLLGFEGRIARENWIEQAQILSKGGETAYSREMARRAAEAPRPARLAEALQSRAAAASTPAAAAPAPGSDLSGLRSVRSEAYRGADSASPAAAGRAADDLKRIRGVGVLIEKKLNGLGVSRYDQVANWTQADIERFSEKLDFKGRIERENWVEQARILSAGGQTEFSQRVDRGEVETSKPKV